jgi:cell division protein FtsB
MPQVSEPRPGSRRTGGVEPLRRKRVSPARGPSSAARRRALNVLLIFVTVVLVADALIGEKGLLESVHARRQYREVAASLDGLRRDNIRLRDEARRLREDPGAIEAMAREQLGLIRPGEVLFIIKDETPAR